MYTKGIPFYHILTYHLDIQRNRKWRYLSYKSCIFITKLVSG